MSNIDKRALREAAEKANPEQYGYYLVDAFTELATPATVLALLDELEAKDKRLNEILAPNMLLPAIDDMDEDNLRHVIKTVCENYSLLHAKWEAAENRAEAAEKRIAELQAMLARLYAECDTGERRGNGSQSGVAMPSWVTVEAARLLLGVK
ncbi:ead/Ea22-like family protein [Enterobacter roggenkampii]|uniref:ead/Ea22-like family protein n=1 Tax=Enterobacter roggenkampii TaxID=1812935 RepID=UPI002021EF4A|nr:ead/Ea22-like family protein [Enterobacter roggenkampii]MCL8153544.1 ead/Ea22-like family protein [Enterobacter roggenkampii]MCM7560361.1 ead/Ea22-like family protein [Enterobacter roggenkampii]